VRSADRAFALVVALALASGALLIALLAVLLPRAAQLLTRRPDELADVVALVLLVLAICGIALGGASLCRQLLATAALIRALVARTVPVPAKVQAAARGLKIDGRIDVVGDRRAFSFCHWFVQPRICLSTTLVRRLDREELRAVLLHERYHLRQRDPLRLVVARYFAAGLYVVPVVDELVGFYTLQKEIAADEDAVRATGDVRDLARALYKLLPAADEVALGLLAPVSSLSVTEARIDRLVAGREAPIRLSAVSVALSAGSLVGAAVLVSFQVGASGSFERLPPLIAVLGLVVGPASLVFVAAVEGALHQFRLVARPGARSSP
jgi:beta-lactamase regulating signal transducer with metallopeptidase domain